MEKRGDDNWQSLSFYLHLHLVYIGFYFDFWLVYSSLDGSSYCGCSNTSKPWVGRSTAQEASILETSDFDMVGLGMSQLKFDLVVGWCNKDSNVPVKYPVRFEVSFDHGVTWRLFNSLKFRGEGGGPQTPSVYFETNGWKTHYYSLSAFSNKRYFIIFIIIYVYVYFKHSESNFITW